MLRDRARGRDGFVSAAYEAVIGLEIHVQLLTKTKMFCGCELEFGAEPNTHTCPVCLGHPGALPVANEQAIAFALRIAVALGCEIAPRSIFHRKNYFYPDLPKGYQISQYDIPICSGGRLGEIRVHRAHLEEDAAKLTHIGESGRIHGSGASTVDYNRGGTPLVEIVTEPDIRDAATARQWLTLLRTTLRQLGVSDVNMDEGSLRCDANISVRLRGQTELGTKTELKNMNSFRFIERGIEAEIDRQIGIVEAGGEVDQATMHYDPQSGSLTLLRSKEEAHDYRYFPEPDLVPIEPAPELIERIRADLPELPAARRERYRADLGLGEDDATQLAFDAELGAFFEDAAARAEASAPVVANWVTGELARAARESGTEDATATEVDPAALATLADLVEEKTISRKTGRELIGRIASDGGDPRAIVDDEGLAQVTGGSELEAAVDRAIESEPEAAEKVRGGDMKPIGALVGAVMREMRGQADGGEVTRMLREKLTG
ncbi:MAG: Asp-tRNA(Asn)/Glu-tRNA(Gln) amidotransferase subunit GatB [Solirubrobacterales bacterium]